MHDMWEAALMTNSYDVKLYVLAVPVGDHGWQSGLDIMQRVPIGSTVGEMPGALPVVVAEPLVYQIIRIASQHDQLKAAVDRWRAARARETSVRDSDEASADIADAHHRLVDQRAEAIATMLEELFDVDEILGKLDEMRRNL